MKKFVSWVSVCTIGLWSCLPSAALAADIEMKNAETISPEQYVGPGNLEYLNDKIQAGYYVPEFSRMDSLQDERINKRNNIENLVQNSFQAHWDSFQQIAIVKDHQDYAAYQLKGEFEKAESKAVQVLSAHTIDTYMPFSDGSIQYFKDGLLMMSKNARSVDEYGNETRKDMYNMQYTEGRMLKSYDSITTDNLGNVSTQSWECTYTGDSVFWGGDSAKANKHYQSYTITETDHNGNVTKTTWDAGNYDGKFLTDYTQKTEQTINGTESNTQYTKVSSLKRYNIEYNAPGVIKAYDEQGVDWHDPSSSASEVPYTYEVHRSNLLYNALGQTQSYHEVRYDKPPFKSDSKEDLDYYFSEEGKKQWTTTTSDVTLEYQAAPCKYGNDVETDPSRLKGSRVVSTMTSADGATRTETSVTTYEYDQNGTLIGGTGVSDFSGLSAKWIEYTTTITNDDGEQEAVTLIREGDGDAAKYYYWTKAEVDEDNDGYVDGKKVYVDSTKVTSTDKDGSRYSGTTTTTYQIVGGQPMAETVETDINSYGVDNETIVSTQSSTTTYEYGMVNNNVVLLSTTEESSSGQPQQDEDLEHLTKKSLTTTYSYDDLGNLWKVSGSGTGSGWEYSDRTSFKDPYTTAITTEYEVKLGRPLLTKTTETREYKKSSN